MAGWDDVRRLALALPETTERRSSRTAAWLVSSRPFAWERYLTRPERELLDRDTGPALGLRTADHDVRDGLLALLPRLCFLVPGYAGVSAVLVDVGAASVDDLEELLADAWACRAPKRLAQQLGRDG